MSRSDRLFTDGAAYEQLMGRWSRRVGDVFVQWIGAPPDLRWLDIGCGTGVFTEQVVRGCAPAAVTGVDPSPEQLAFAERRGLAGAEFRVRDAQDLPFADESFDIAVMALVVHFIPDPGKAVAEMARVLRRGGWGTAYVWDFTKAGSPTAPLAAAMKAIGLEAPMPPSPHATSSAALRDLWRGAGFAGLEERTIAIPVEFAGFEEFWRSMTVPVGPTGQAIAAMTPDGRARLRSALEQQLPARADGRVVYEARANAIKGRKPG
ncbi:MAG TPA: methyltransferase domain-containing protein [Beijerinckiaceae bacterium]|jgi:ubiquinone/menaquinone biosynthesis C-methylase UbiE